MTTGLDPAVLLDLDGRMFDAVERAAGERWTVLDELTAQTLELLSALFSAFLASHGVKRPPAVLHVPRPHELTREPPKLDPLAFAVEYGAGAGG